MKNINLGPQQLALNFEKPAYEQNLLKVLSVIDSMIAKNDRITLDEVAMHFSMLPDEWSEKHIHDLVLDLFKDDKIHFIINGKKILPESIKTLLSEPTHSESNFLQTREIFSVVKTYFSEPANWKYIEITKPEVVKEPVLLKANQLSKKLFKDVSLLNQNSLCNHLRKHLRMWKNDLTEFRRVAGTGKYPGTNEIQQGLDFLEKLLNVYDPSEFIKTFINNEDRLCKTSSDFIILKNFFNNQIYLWDTLIKAVENFMPNRLALEKDPDVKKALQALDKILSNPEPYSMIKEVNGIISIVKTANDLIVAEQIASAKALAIKKIEKKIAEISKVLDEKRANSDIRNNVLYPLQSSKKKIAMASSIHRIADFLNDAMDHFDNAMDMID